MSIDTSAIEAAARGNHQLRTVLSSFASHLEAVATHVGYTPIKGPGMPVDRQLAVPPRGTINVLGQDGHFYVDLVMPLPAVDHRGGDLPGSRVLAGDPWGANDGRRSRALDILRQRDGRRLTSILHELQSSTALTFDAAANVTTYGPSSQIHYDILDPNVQKYWRFRSRYPNSDANPWTYFESAAVCGVIAVDSGVLRSPNFARNGILNATNFATVDSVDAGTSATARIYGNGGVGTTWNEVLSDLTGFGTQNVPFPAGQVAGLAYATLYYVMWNGTSYVALTSLPATLPDKYVFVGQVTTVAAGGGGGTSGGGGGTGGGGGGGGHRFLNL